ncbi:MAG: extracellular solute-binding protein [Butyrivibrio sp.]|jgi:putative aldouronate transport system substrate-binding protein|nr:extracellular solute-binding protein [Butyrivibrio sp.]
MYKKIVAIMLSLVMLGSVSSCQGKNEDEPDVSEITEFSAFFAVPGIELNKDNDIQNIIAEKTGVRVKESWLSGQTVQEAISTMIVRENYPDFVDGGSSSYLLYEAGALIPIDEYFDDYPNIRNFMSEQEWDQLRQEDGHIYWIPQFQNIKEGESECIHNDEAFWIQARVLKWAGYPEIRTLDEYFDLLERYSAANPVMEDGTAVIPYTILCEDWRYYCLENAPEFLDGYPNDGSVIVDPDTLTVIDYNVTDTAKEYFKKLNEEYAKGIIDAESFTQTYDEYISKLSTGRVLGMVDQWWNFAYSVEDAMKQTGLDEQGCQYVPLPITISRDVQNQWHTAGDVLNVSSGLAITKDCSDIEKALQFVDDLLSPEIHNLRFWGVEGVDYNVGDDGIFYRTEEQRNNVTNSVYKVSHICNYSYFPQWLGISDDGINATMPSNQPYEFYDGLSDSLKECFDAYGVKTYVEMLGSNESPGDWFPLYTYSNTLTNKSAGGLAWTMMGEIKHEYLPQVVMASDFDSAWEAYMSAYYACHPEDFLQAMQTELDRRIQEAAKYH